MIFSFTFFPNLFYGRIAAIDNHLTNQLPSILKPDNHTQYTLFLLKQQYGAVKKLRHHTSNYCYLQLLFYHIKLRL
ncbi:hypothetical protein HMPREF1548_01400 [Clostridium sp. KLE 1755]|nr:hypothetical protein HMPREF1548_01400 [Clostridium sp. KLE 1755]